MIIDVNHRQISTMADTVASFKDEITRNTGVLVDRVDSTVSSWSGDDKTAFATKWNSLRDNDSNYKKMIDYLESYSESLKEASKKYKTAQVDSINQANSI